MAYVDLNPIRAAMAKTPDTSLQAALRNYPARREKTTHAKIKSTHTTTPSLLAFAGNEHDSNSPEHIPFHFADYLELVDWTGRIIRCDKRGSIPQQLPPLLQRLNIQPQQWLRNCKQLEVDYHLAIGSIEKLEQLCEKLNQCWLKGKTAYQLFLWERTLLTPYTLKKLINQRLHYPCGERHAKNV